MKWRRGGLPGGFENENKNDANNNIENENNNGFFSLEIQLDGLRTKLSPSIDEVREAIKCGATTILKCSILLQNEKIKKSYNLEEKKEREEKVFLAVFL